MFQTTWMCTDVSASRPIEFKINQKAAWMSTGVEFTPLHYQLGLSNNSTDGMTLLSCVDDCKHTETEKANKMVSMNLLHFIILIEWNMYFHFLKNYFFIIYWWETYLTPTMTVCIAIVGALFVFLAWVSFFLCINIPFNQLWHFSIQFFMNHVYN